MHKKILYSILWMSMIFLLLGGVMVLMVWALKSIGG